MLLNHRHQLPDGTEIGCLLVGAEGGKRPALLLLSEIFGVNAAMALAADSLARAGYLALAPDLYARIAPGTSLLYSPDERNHALGLWAKLDLGRSLADLGDVCRAVRESPHCDGRVGAVGFCLGGQLALLAALDGHVDAAVAFYPVKVPDYAQRLGQLNRPVQVHVGDCDPHLPPAHLQALKDGLGAASRSELRIYAGADHGFYNSVREVGFHPEHSAAAHDAMLDFLAAHLPDVRPCR